jgi:soluble lytic murein transglycosylase-like protein
VRIVLGRAVPAGLMMLASAAAAAEPAAPHMSGGTVEQTVCSLVDNAARANHVSVELLTRLIWTESRFRAGAVSPKGAQGIAQFMPQTAAARGLADPFDPEQAVPKAARLVADLTRRFGNVGLAAAAYNAGSDRVASWLAGSGHLPAETQAYVISVTGIPAEDWKRAGAAANTGNDVDESESCAAVTASLRTEEAANPIPIAPWGVQLAGNFSKAVALASFARAAQRYQRIIGNTQPMVIYGVLRSRGRLPFYRVMIPEASRADADRTCQAILAIGGACVALRS